jgi:hypothetical protein
MMIMMMVSMMMIMMMVSMMMMMIVVMMMIMKMNTLSLPTTHSAGDDGGYELHRFYEQRLEII